MCYMGPFLVIEQIWVVLVCFVPVHFSTCIYYICSCPYSSSYDVIYGRKWQEWIHERIDTSWIVGIIMTKWKAMKFGKTMSTSQCRNETDPPYEHGTRGLSHSELAYYINPDIVSAKVKLSFRLRMFGISIACSIQSFCHSCFATMMPSDEMARNTHTQWIFLRMGIIVNGEQTESVTHWQSQSAASQSPPTSESVTLRVPTGARGDCTAVCFHFHIHI